MSKIKTRYEIYAIKNRKRCSIWRKKNKEWLKRYRQRPHIKKWRREYHKKYMVKWRARMKKEAQLGR